MPSLHALSNDPVLRNYAQRSAQSRTRARANFLAPTVDVANPIGRFKRYDDKHRFKIPDTLRAPGGEAVEVSFNAKDATYNCSYHAVDHPMDRMEEDAAQDLTMDMAMEALDLIADVQALSHERRVISDALSALDAGKVSKNFKSDSIDPIDEIDALIEEVIKNTLGQTGIRIAFGPTAFRRFKANKNVKNRFIKKTAASEANTISINDIGTLLMGEPRCELFAMIQDTAHEGLDASMSYLLSDGIIVFAAQDNPTRMDPSFMKTFRKMSSWMKPRIYQTPSGRVNKAGVDWSEDVQITNTLAGKLLIGADS